MPWENVQLNFSFHICNSLMENDKNDLKAISDNEFMDIYTSKLFMNKIEHKVNKQSEN